MENTAFHIVKGYVPVPADPDFHRIVPAEPDGDIKIIKAIRATLAMGYKGPISRGGSNFNLSPVNAYPYKKFIDTF